MKKLPKRLEKLYDEIVYQSDFDPSVIKRLGSFCINFTEYEDLSHNDAKMVKGIIKFAPTYYFFDGDYNMILTKGTLKEIESKLKGVWKKVQKDFF